MIKFVLLTASIVGFLLVSNAAFCDDLSEIKSRLQKVEAENKALMKELNKQKNKVGKQKEIIEAVILTQKIIEVLRDKIDSIEKNAGVASQSQQNVRGIVKEVLSEKDREKELTALFSEGGADNMLFHGYVDLEWKNVDFDSAQGGSRKHNYFDNHHFNLWFGYILADNLITKGEIEVEHGGDEFKLEFGEIEWNPFSNDKLQLLMGKLLIPLGIENPVHASVWNKLISRPLPSRSIIPGTYADIGVEARGWLPSMANTRFRYHLYLVNGLGDDDGDNIYEQKSLKRSRDNNSNKAVGGQIALFPVNGVEIGGSGYFGKWDDKDENNTFIVGTHFIFFRGPVDIRAEYIFQNIENANGPASQNADLHGWYVQGAYKLPRLMKSSFLEKWELIARYGAINNEDGVASLKQGNIPAGKTENRIAMGLNFRPQDWLQFKLEYLYRNNEDKENDKGLAFQTVANW